MLIIRDGGRLGNQLFQYAAIRTLAQPGERPLLLGFEDLQATFEGIEAKIINPHSPTLSRLQYYCLNKLGKSLSHTKMISKITDSRESADIFYTLGLFKQINFIDGSFFQGESFFEPQSLAPLTLKDSLVSYAQNLLQAITQGRVPVFVHIRRGDYTHWPDRENPAVLPASYYRQCMDIISSKIHNPLFIFTSDDSPYVQDMFGELENIYISKGSSLEDFAIMTCCPNGILSASSFSWWATYFANLNHLNPLGSLFLAPKFWIGHRLQSWHPPFIESRFLTYIDVQ